MSQSESGTKRATDELPHSPKKPRLDEENTADSPMSISMEDEKKPETIVTVTGNFSLLFSLCNDTNLYSL